MRGMQGWKLAAVAVLAAVVGATAATGIVSARDDGRGDAATSSGPTKALGGVTTESKFVPVTPCRLVDTRVNEGAFLANQIRFYDVRGTGPTFAFQGGKPGGCGIPTTGVAAIQINVTSVKASKAGYLRLFSNIEPTATFLNYSNVMNAGSSGVVPLCQTACTADDDFAVKNYLAKTDVVVDIQGYYPYALSAMVNSDGTLARHSRAVASSRVALGTYSVTFDRDISACSFTASNADPTTSNTFGQVSVTRLSGNSAGVWVVVQNSSGSSADGPFSVLVTC